MITNSSTDPEFIDLELNRWTMENYFVRNAVLRALQRSLPEINGTVLDVGCGKSPYRKLLLSPPSRAVRYLGLDFVNPLYTALPDVPWEGGNIPLESQSIESAVATEVLEHNPCPHALLQEVHRVLKPGGFLFVTVPFLWPLHDVPHDEFRYTPFSLERLHLQAGFSRVRVDAMGGWDAALATMIGLWVHRRPMRDPWRGIFSRVAFPIYKRLIAADRPPTQFDKSVMITGLSVAAWK